IWKGLKLKTSLSLNQSMSFSETYTPTFLTSDNNGYGGESTSRSFTTVFDNTLSYAGNINDIHALDAVVGISFERTKDRGFGLYVSNYPMDEILTGITNATEFESKNGSGTVYGLQSSFARINYRLLDKYLFTFTARYDGSSSFGSNNRLVFPIWGYRLENK
ncbi:MAG: SusC/RagA family TonB-linked outer membrane protein, partial [Butyricimonas faecihominis]